MKNKCDVCGRRTNRIYKSWSYTMCSKHMHQFHKYGKFLDNNPRTNNDLNDYWFDPRDSNIVHFNLYNQKNELIGNFIIDKEDIEKVKYHKWRISHKYVVTGLPAKGTQRDLAHVVLDIDARKTDLVVDHINNDSLDNRKTNLRICTQAQNCCNKLLASNSTSGFAGVSYRKDRDVYDPEISIQHTRCHLGYCKDFKEAVYKRFYAEQLIFKDFKNDQEQQRKYEFIKDLPESKKKQLQKIVKEKLTNKDLWQ